MSIFGKIKDTIFGHKKAQPEAAAPTAAPVPAPGQGAAPAPAPAAVQAPPQPVDVRNVLIELWVEKGKPNLNYDTSIADLMRLLDLDPSLANRKELATELGYGGAKDGSAEMNIWLHKRVLEELAANGGVVPAKLKD